MNTHANPDYFIINLVIDYRLELSNNLIVIFFILLISMMKIAICPNIFLLLLAFVYSSRWWGKRKSCSVCSKYSLLFCPWFLVKFLEEVIVLFENLVTHCFDHFFEFSINYLLIYLIVIKFIKKCTKIKFGEKWPKRMMPKESLPFIWILFWKIKYQFKRLFYGFNFVLAYPEWKKVLYRLKPKYWI